MEDLNKENTQNTDQNVQNPPVGGENTSNQQETSQNSQNDLELRLKEMERKLQESNTRNATLETRFQELQQNNQTQQTQQQINNAPTLDDRVKRLADSVIDDPALFQQELTNTLKEVQQETLFQAQALMTGNMAINELRAKHPHLKDFEPLLTQKADQIAMQKKIPYNQALMEAADGVNSVLESYAKTKIESVNPPVNNPEPPVSNGTQGVTTQTSGQTETTKKIVRSIQDEIEARNEALRNKANVR